MQIKSLDEVINRLQYKADNIKAKLEPSYFTECIEYLKSLPLCDNGWIPCSERLPSEKGEYLVTFHPCCWDSVQEGVMVGTDTFRGKSTWAKKKYQRVIAWQPLPAHYQPKGE